MKVISLHAAQQSRFKSLFHVVVFLLQEGHASTSTLLSKSTIWRRGTSSLSTILSCESYSVRLPLGVRLCQLSIGFRHYTVDHAPRPRVMLPVLFLMFKSRRRQETRNPCWDSHQFHSWCSNGGGDKKHDRPCWDWVDGGRRRSFGISKSAEITAE